MQFGRTHLSTEERERSIIEHLCPTRPPQQYTPRVSASVLPSYSTSCIEVPVKITFLTNTLITKALLDSGAAGSFIDEGLDRQYEIPQIPLDSGSGSGSGR